jgi:hypothetical protein
MRQRSKTADVLRHLEEHGSITSMEAIELFGATRPSAIIFNLRKRGYDIETVTEGALDRYGRAANYARYVLRRDDGKSMDQGRGRPDQEVLPDRRRKVEGMGEADA